MPGGIRHLYYVILLACQPCVAQLAADSASFIRKPLLVFKLAPLSLFDPDNTFQAGAEYCLSDRWSLQSEFGYGNYRTNLVQQDQYGRYNGKENKEVWRTRFEVRHYYTPFYQNPHNNPYVALEVFYKRVNFLENKTLGRDCDQGNCAYFEDVAYKVFKNVVGSHIKVGFQRILFKRFLSDIYFGFGFRLIYINAPGLPESAVPQNGRQFLLVNISPISPDEPGSYQSFSMSLGLKLGYLLFKKPK